MVGLNFIDNPTTVFLVFVVYAKLAVISCDGSLVVKILSDVVFSYIDFIKPFLTWPILFSDVDIEFCPKSGC